MSLIKRVEASTGTDFARGAVSFFADVSYDVVHGMGEFQDSAAKYAIALGIYKLAVLITVDFFEII